MAEIHNEDGSVRWYIEMVCPNGHRTHASGNLVRHKRVGTESFVVHNVERSCVLCEEARLFDSRSYEPNEPVSVLDLDDGTGSA